MSGAILDRSQVTLSVYKSDINDPQSPQESSDLLSHFNSKQSAFKSNINLWAWRKTENDCCQSPNRIPAMKTKRAHRVIQSERAMIHPQSIKIYHSLLCFSFTTSISWPTKENSLKHRRILAQHIGLEKHFFSSARAWEIYSIFTNFNLLFSTHRISKQKMW